MTASRFSILPLLLCIALFALGILLIQLGQRALGYSLVTQLYGSNSLTSCGVLLASCAPLFFVVQWLRKRGVDFISLCILVLSALIGLHYIHISSDISYTNDFTGHITYAQFIMRNWFRPYFYSGWQDHQPPTYYYVAAIALRFTEWLDSVLQPTALRFVSWIAYLVFSAYSLLALRRAGLSGTGYYASALLLLFWPGGFHMASKISPEPFYYACYAAAFYYALLWYQQGRQGYLIGAIALAGFAFAVKTSAVIIFGVIGMLMLVEFFRGRLTISKQHYKAWALVTVAVMLCVVINSLKVFWYGYPVDNHLGMVGNMQRYNYTHYLTVHPEYTLTHPFNDRSLKQGFWEYILKTSMFGEYQWPSAHLASVMVLLLIVIFFYTMLPWLFASRARWRGMLPYGVNLLIPVMFLMLFMERTDALPGQDARYIYPSLVCFMVFFGKSHALYEAWGMRVVSLLGPSLVTGFALLSAFFFLTNAR